MPVEVQIVVASDPRCLRLIRRLVAEYVEMVGCDPAAASEVILAVSEAASNIIQHSYKGDPGQKLSVHCRESEDGVEIEIRDNGEPFDPHQPPPGPPDELRAGGRGVYLMQTVMDEIEYRREGTTNCVRMRKCTRTPAASGGGDHGN